MAGIHFIDIDNRNNDMTEKEIYRLECELRRLGYKETDENEYLCTRTWTKDFEYYGKIYRGFGRYSFTIWDYTRIRSYDRFKYQGSAVMSIGGLIKSEFSIWYAIPEEIEQKVIQFLDGELPQLP